MKKEIKNLPASVHDRLKKLAIGEGRPYDANDLRIDSDENYSFLSL
jgi:hypothetical protein